MESRRSSGRPGSPRARLFVALDLPEDAREALAHWRDQAIAGRDDLRAVAREALHVTLAFLGYRPEKEIEQIAAALRAALAGPVAPVLESRGVKAVPPRRPRLFALDLEDRGGGASALQAAVSRALEAGGFYAPEKRPFWPHVTLARVKRGRSAAPLGASAPPSREWSAEAVTLYRSDLRPQGAVYIALERVILGS